MGRLVPSFALGTHTPEDSTFPHGAQLAWQTLDCLSGGVTVATCPWVAKLTGSLGRGQLCLSLTWASVTPLLWSSGGEGALGGEHLSGPFSGLSSCHLPAFSG